MGTRFIAPGTNFLSTTLNGAISDSATTITLNSTTNLRAPGYLVIDREDGSGNATPNAREVIFYTGISGSDLTGVTRGADGSTARSHSDGALVEATVTVGLWNSLASIVDMGLNNDGYLRAMASPVSIARLQGNQAALNSIASLAEIQFTRLMGTNATVTNYLGASGASIVGFPLTPTFVFVGSLSGPTTFVQTPLVMPRAATLSFVNFITRTVASGASMFIDINRNGVSIFDAGTRPVIAAGGTFYSSASILTKTLNRADRITWDLDGASSAGHITDFNIELVSG